MGSLIENLLSGQSVQPRQAAQAPMDIGSLMSFISQGQAQAPQLPQPEQGRGGGADIGSILQLFHMYKQSKDKSKAQEYMRQLLGTPGQERIPTPLLNAKDAVPGTGMLGGKMTLPEFAAGLVGSPDEAAQNAGFQMYQDMAKPRTKTQTSIHSMGAPGKDGYKVNFYLDENNQPVPVGEPYKEGAGVTINTGDTGKMMEPASSADKAAWGIPNDVPATRNNKTGEVQAHPKAVSEDQAKSGMFYGSLDRAIKSMDSVMKNGNTTDIESNLKDFVGDTVSSIPTGITQNIGNAMKSGNRQLFDQARAEAITAVVHSMSGSGFSVEEQQLKANMIVPRWGDRPEAIDAKLNTMKGIESDLARRAGPALQQPVEKSISKSGKPMIKVNGVWEYE
jgi:hypothetical protein